VAVQEENADVRAAEVADQELIGSADWHRPFPRVPLYLAGATVVLGMLSLGLPNIAPDVDFLAAPGSPVRMFFGVSEEMNLPTFFSVMVAVAGAATQALAGRLTGGRVGRALYVTAALLFAMAFDDFTALHERLDSLGEDLVPEGTTGYLWVLPGLVPAFVVLLAFWRLSRALRGEARRDLLVGIVTLMVAALGIESVNGLFDHPGGSSVLLQLGTHVEELTETLGLVLVLRGSLAMLLVRRGAALSIRIADEAIDGP
jgi:hypothetical protein